MTSRPGIGEVSEILESSRAGWGTRFATVEKQASAPIAAGRAKEAGVPRQGPDKKVLNRRLDRDDHPGRAPRRKSEVRQSSARRRARDAATRAGQRREPSGRRVCHPCWVGGRLGHHRQRDDGLPQGQCPGYGVGFGRADFQRPSQRGRSDRGAHAAALAGAALQFQRLWGRGSGHDPGHAAPGLPGDGARVGN
jgi:hypothetical protein